MNAENRESMGEFEMFLRSLVGRDFEFMNKRGPLKRVIITSFPDSDYRCITFGLSWIEEEDESGQNTIRTPQDEHEEMEGIDPRVIIGLEYLHVTELPDGSCIFKADGSLMPPITIHAKTFDVPNGEPPSSMFKID